MAISLSSIGRHAWFRPSCWHRSSSFSLMSLPHSTGEPAVSPVSVPCSAFRRFVLTRARGRGVEWFRSGVRPVLTMLIFLSAAGYMWNLSQLVAAEADALGRATAHEMLAQCKRAGECPSHHRGGTAEQAERASRWSSCKCAISGETITPLSASACGTGRMTT